MHELSYCYKCGHKLSDNHYCFNCELHSPKFIDLQNKVNGVSRWKGTITWIQRYTNISYGWIGKYISVNMCHKCKYFMYHTLQWCPYCGGQFDKQKIETDKLVQNYPTYKEGY